MKRRAKKSKLPVGEAAFNATLSRYKDGARSRDISWGLTAAQFKGLTSADCFYCNAPPSMQISCRNYNGSYIYNGIDRVDSDKGYTLDNCVTCCAPCNRIKGSTSKDLFLSQIQKIHKHLFSRSLVSISVEPPPMPDFIKEEYKHLLCQCRSPEHCATVFFDDDIEWVLAVHLQPHRSFWKRLKHAFKYLFRREPCKYGHWDEMILRRDDLIQLKKMLSVVH